MNEYELLGRIVFVCICMFGIYQAVVLFLIKQWFMKKSELSIDDLIMLRGRLCELEGTFDREDIRILRCLISKELQDV